VNGRYQFLKLQITINGKSDSISITTKNQDGSLATDAKGNPIVLVEHNSQTEPLSEFMAKNDIQSIPQLLAMSTSYQMVDPHVKMKTTSKEQTIKNHIIQNSYESIKAYCKYLSTQLQVDPKLRIINDPLSLSNWIGINHKNELVINENIIKKTYDQNIVNTLLEHEFEHYSFQNLMKELLTQFPGKGEQMLGLAFDYVMDAQRVIKTDGKYLQRLSNVNEFMILGDWNPLTNIYKYGGEISATMAIRFIQWYYLYSLNVGVKNVDPLIENLFTRMEGIDSESILTPFENFFEAYNDNPSMLNSLSDTDFGIVNEYFDALSRLIALQDIFIRGQE
jgi:hypothetical protein